MIRTLTLAAAATAVLATAPAHAIEYGNMSEAERADFHAAIREYLLENPEVLMEAIAVLEAREAEERSEGPAAEGRAREREAHGGRGLAGRRGASGGTAAQTPEPRA